MSLPVLILRGCIGIAAMVGIAYLFSTNRRAIDWRLVGAGIGLQLVFAVLVLYTDAGAAAFRAIGQELSNLSGLEIHRIIVGKNEGAFV